ncbi:MAG: hypothetical protein R6T91_06445 [Bacteroidales bacterium]
MDFETLSHDADLVAEINEMIDMHLEEEEPKITSQTFKRLVDDGFTDFQVRNLIGKCIAYELTSDRGFDDRRYKLHLSYLPNINFEW